MGDKWFFRGWDAVGEKGWGYGDLSHNQKVTETGLEPRVMVGGYEVVLESVGLWTGLKDKKGHLIYEGDIMFSEFLDKSCGYSLIGWNEKTCSFGMMDSYSYRSIKEGYDYAEFKNYVLLAHLKDAIIFEIIGNIYQNRELLEECYGKGRIN
jgi:hypothetical protein